MPRMINLPVASSKVARLCIWMFRPVQWEMVDGKIRWKFRPMVFGRSFPFFVSDAPRGPTGRERARVNVPSKNCREWENTSAARRRMESGG